MSTPVPDDPDYGWRAPDSATPASPAPPEPAQAEPGAAQADGAGQADSAGQAEGAGQSDGPGQPDGPGPDMVAPGANGYLPADYALPAVGYGTEPVDPDRPKLGTELLVALGVAAVITVLGFPLGWLWSAVAPKVPVQMIAQGAVLAQPEQEQLIADEGWYLLITVVAGVLFASLVWAFLRRYRGAPMAVGLALGSAFGGVLAAWFGSWIGADHFRDLAAHAPVGTNFSLPVNLRIKEVGLWQGWLPYARGDVLALAIAASVIYLLLAGFSAHSSLRRPPRPAQQPGSATPVGWAAPGGGLPGPTTPGPDPGGAPFPSGTSAPLSQPVPPGSSA